MRPKEDQAVVLWLLLAAFLFSAVGLIGKVTELTPGAISFGRSVAAALCIGVAARVVRLNLRLPPGQWGLTLLAGLAQAANWGLFFAAIQTGGMSVAVIALFTYPILTALVEPLVTRQRMSPAELVGGALVLCGVFFVTPEADLSNQVTLGVALGVLSAFALTLRNLVGRGLAAEMGSLKLNFWMCAACIPVFLPFRLHAGGAPTPSELWQVAALGILFTVAPQYIFFDSLKKVTAATASLVVSAQPVLSILLAALLFAERIDARTWIGGACIVAAVIIVSAFRPAAPPSRASQHSQSASPPQEG
jgi:drug/metabolite transporter (DMT)-like permease